LGSRKEGRIKYKPFEEAGKEEEGQFGDKVQNNQVIVLILHRINHDGDHNDQQEGKECRRSDHYQPSNLANDIVFGKENVEPKRNSERKEERRNLSVGNQSFALFHFFQAIDDERAKVDDTDGLDDYERDEKNRNAHVCKRNLTDLMDDFHNCNGNEQEGCNKS